MTTTRAPTAMGVHAGGGESERRKRGEELKLEVDDEYYDPYGRPGTRMGTRRRHTHGTSSTSALHTTHTGIGIGACESPLDARGNTRGMGTKQQRASAPVLLGPRMGTSPNAGGAGGAGGASGAGAGAGAGAGTSGERRGSGSGGGADNRGLAWQSLSITSFNSTSFANDMDGGMDGGFGMGVGIGPGGDRDQRRVSGGSGSGSGSGGSPAERAIAHNFDSSGDHLALASLSGSPASDGEGHHHALGLSPPRDGTIDINGFGDSVHNRSSWGSPSERGSNDRESRRSRPSYEKMTHWLGISPQKSGNSTASNGPPNGPSNGTSTNGTNANDAGGDGSTRQR